MADLILVRGLPGSGKSTYAKKLQVEEAPGIFHLETDMFFSQKTGTYQFDPTKLKQADEWCQAQARGFLLSNQRVVVSNTFTKLWKMQAYLDMAAELGKSVKVISVSTQYPNIHGVPGSTIEKMRFRWEKYPGEEIV